MAQDRASDERRENVERSATESSASQASPAPLLLSLQQSAGNRAVAGLIQRLREGSGETRSAHDAPAPGERLIQRAPWKNFPAKFQTKNNERDPDTKKPYPNSEYDVEAETYTRYAPINEKRAPHEVNLSGKRSFAYIKEEDDNTSAVTDTAVARADGNEITLESKSTGYKVSAKRVPEPGLSVWDAGVEDSGTVKDAKLNGETVVDKKGKPVKDIHIGHEVVNLEIAREDWVEYDTAMVEYTTAEEAAKRAEEERRLATAEWSLADFGIVDPGQANAEDPGEANADDLLADLDLLAGLSVGGGELEPAFETEVGDEGQDTGKS